MSYIKNIGPDSTVHSFDYRRVLAAVENARGSDSLHRIVSSWKLCLERHGHALDDEEITQIKALIVVAGLRLMDMGS